MSGIGREALAFFEAVLSGMIVCSAYSCIWKFRKIVRHNLLFISIEDLLYWIGTAIYLFVQIYYTSDGRIRWYFVLGVVFGGAIFIGVQRELKKIAKKMYTQKGSKFGKSIELKKEKR